MVGSAEDIEVLLLIILDNHLGDLSVGGSTDDSRETRGRTVDELDAALPEDDVVGRADPDLAGINIRILRIDIEIGLPENTQGLFHLIGEDTGHTGIEEGSEVGQMVAALDMRRQQAAGELHRFFEVFQGLALDTGQRVDDRQIVGGIGKPDLGAGVIGLQGLLQLALDLRHDLVTTLNGCKCY